MTRNLFIGYFPLLVLISFHYTPAFATSQTHNKCIPLLSNFMNVRVLAYRSNIGGQQGARGSNNRFVFQRDKLKLLIQELVELKNTPTKKLKNQLPSELEQLITSNQEIRIYFQGDKLNVRLTIRRNPDNTWSFGSTTSQTRKGQIINESFDIIKSDADAHSSERFSYFTSEQIDLKKNYSTDHKEAVRQLKAQVIRIHLMFLEGVVSSPQFISTFKDWNQAVPDYFNGTGSLEFFLRTQKSTFELNNGLNQKLSSSLTDEENKFVAAIHYLIMNKKYFYHLSKDIEDLGIDFARNTTPYEGNYEQDLFTSLVNIGLKYEHNQWLQSKE